MDPCSDVSLVCHVNIETVDMQKTVVKNERFKNGSLSLWRNEFREIVLVVSKTEKALPLKFILRDIKIHSKFMKEGKSSLTLVNDNVRLLLSNCPPHNLKSFLRILSVKFTNYAKYKSGFHKNKLIAGLPKSFEEISPLSEKDLQVLNESRLRKNVDKLSNKKPIAVYGKRQLPFSNQINNHDIVEPAVKKRLLVLPTTNLSSEQHRILNIVKQGKNIFFTGSAGTGKSFLIRHILGILPPTDTVVTASTGVAACHIGGMTLHSFVGFKSSGSVDQIIQSIRHRKPVVQQWRACKHLVIDEISMIDADFFDCIEAVAKNIRNNNEPFGGIHLIFSGDFFQLPPVSKGQNHKKFCFQAKSWTKCIESTVELQKVYRQTDRKFIHLLQNIRLGICDLKTAATLKATRKNKLEQNGVLSTKLCTHVNNVKQINQDQLELLDGETVSYEGHDSSEAFTPFLNKLLPDTQVIKLKIGTQVMLTKNLNVGNKLVNGARGVIVSFTNTENRLPVVRFLSGLKHAIQYETFTVKISSDITAFRKQLPLQLAWAISIHKSQGMTLDCVEMSLSRVFENGQAYVALSRATSLQSLRVLDFDSSCVRSSVDVLRFYRQLRYNQQHSIA